MNKSTIKLNSVYLSDGKYWTLTIDRISHPTLANHQYLLISDKEFQKIVEMQQNNWCESYIIEEDESDE